MVGGYPWGRPPIHGQVEDPSAGSLGNDINCAPDTSKWVEIRWKSRPVPPGKPQPDAA